MAWNQSKINPPLRHECKYCGVKFKHLLQLYNHTAFCVLCYTPEQRKARAKAEQDYVDANDL